MATAYEAATRFALVSLIGFEQGANLGLALG
jgi:hypothetical protein